MARKTVKVTIPYRKPDDLLALFKVIIAKDAELANDSPLKTIDMATFKAKNDDVDAQRILAKKLYAEAQTAQQKVETALGIAEGQNLQTPGTMLYLLSIIRDQLLLTYKGQEGKLGEFGFDIKIDTSSTGVKKVATIAK